MKKNTNMVEPYIKGFTEDVNSICDKHRIEVYFKGGRTIKNLLVAPKVKDTITQKSGVSYRYKCARVECDEEHIDEFARTFGERFKEYLKTPSQFMTI